MCKFTTGTILFAVNVLVFPVGIALLVIGALVQWKLELLIDQIVPTLVSTIDDDERRDATNAMLVDLFSFLPAYGVAIFILGIILFVIAFCGLCGVCLKSKFLLGTYAASLIAISIGLLIFTIVYGVASYWLRARMGDLLKEFIVKRFKMDNTKPPNDVFTAFMSNIQHEKHCCGSFNHTDYEENESFKEQSFEIPASCCIQPTDRECWQAPTSANSYKDIGCSDFLWDMIEKHRNCILYILIGLLMFVFLLTLSTIYLIRRYSKERV